MLAYLSEAPSQASDRLIGQIQSELHVFFRPSLSCVKVISLAQRLTSADMSANQICLMHMWDACLHVTAEVCHQEQ